MQSVNVNANPNAPAIIIISAHAVAPPRHLLPARRPLSFASGAAAASRKTR